MRRVSEGVVGRGKVGWGGVWMHKEGGCRRVTRRACRAQVRREIPREEGHYLTPVLIGLLWLLCGL